MNTKQFFMVTTVVEAGAGLALAIAPSPTALLLVGSALDPPAGTAIGRVAGAALVSLGVACWLARRDEGSLAAVGMIAALLLYNVAAAGILAFVGMGSRPSGVGLWPAVVLHSMMAAWCLALVRQGPRPSL